MITVTKPVLPPLEKYVEYLRRIWESRWLTNDGELVHLLGDRLQQYLKAKNLALVSNGTVALELALRALGIRGEVITTPFTFSATSNVLLWLGLDPVFADIDPQTYNLDPEAIEDKITDRTSAILAVHVYGNPCNVQMLQKTAEKHDLKLIYDAAHAFGVEHDGQSILQYGDVSTLSFHATKVFNTIEGGAIVCKEETVFEKLMLLRNHGIRSEEKVVLPGTNAKMNEFQAAMGLCNLDGVDENIMQRKELYEQYKKGLDDTEHFSFQELKASRYNYSYMPVCFKDMKERDAVYEGLSENGIKPRKYFYPLTISYDYLKDRITSTQKHQVRNASKIADRILCLPLYPDLEASAVDEIISRIHEIAS